MPPRPIPENVSAARQDPGVRLADFPPTGTLRAARQARARDGGRTLASEDPADIAAVCKHLKAAKAALPRLLAARAALREVEVEIMAHTATAGRHLEALGCDFFYATFALSQSLGDLSARDANVAVAIDVWLAAALGGAELGE